MKVMVLVKAAEGLHPSSKGARVTFSRTNRSVIDGPFTETKPSPGSNAAPTRCLENPRLKFARSLQQRTADRAGQGEDPIRTHSLSSAVEN
jgi:hypothetical protein